MKRGNPVVYFIIPIDGPGRIKIGYSQSLGRRLSALIIYSPYKLEIAASVVGTKRDEYFIQWRFRTSHVHREWFERSAELDALIAYVAEHKSLPSHYDHEHASRDDLRAFQLREGQGRNRMRPETVAARAARKVSNPATNATSPKVAA